MKRLYSKNVDSLARTIGPFAASVKSLVDKRRVTIAMMYTSRELKWRAPFENVMAKNVQRTYSSIRDYKKKSIKSEGSDDFEKLKNGQSDFSDCRRTVTTNNWSRDTFKSDDQSGKKRVGSQSPLKLARENCKRKRTLDVASRKKLDIYDFSTTEDDVSDSNSCPPSLSVQSATSSDELDTVLSSSQPPSSQPPKISRSKSRSSAIKYDLTFINHNQPPLKPTPSHTTSSPTKPLESSQKPSTSTKPKLVKASTWPKGQPMSKEKEASITKKNEKDKAEVITIANVKQAYQCQEHGEHQKFVDEMKYTMSNLNKSRSEMIRCLSCCNLATHCLRAEFRQRFRARSLTSRILQALNDAPGKKTLALCTATLIFVLTKDQMNQDFDRNSLELITNLMKADELDDEELSGKAHKDYCRISIKVKGILSQIEEWFGSKLGKEATEMHQKESLTVTELMLSSLLNLMSLRDGQSFKGQLRLLGTLDHVASLVVNNSKLLRPSPYPKSRSPKVVSDPEVILGRVIKPLAVLESASYMNKDNQSYLVVYDGSVLVTALTELLCYCQKSNATSNEIAIQSLLATLKVLVNITHDNELGSQRVGEQNNIIDNICHCVLVLPASLEGEKQFDILVMGLGLLINLVECVAQNRQALEELKIEVKGNNSNALSHLVDVFLLHYTAAEQSSINLPMPKSMGISSANSSGEAGRSRRQRTTSSTTEMLDSISKRLLEGSAASGGHEELSGLEWLEEDTVMDEEVMGGSDNGVPLQGQRHSSSDRESEETMEDAFVISREELNTAILQAGKQMEHSFISAYCSLVLGVMCRYSESCRELIVLGMPSRSFKEMISILQQFVNFSDMVNSVSQSGIESVRKIILYLKEFDKDCK